MKSLSFKTIFIIFINLLLTFILVETCCYFHEVILFQKDCKECCLKKLQICDYHKYFFLKHSSFDKTYEMLKPKLKQPVGIKYKSRPILLAGGSFAYGYGLKDNETFQKLLSDLTKRPVYNRAYELWWGLQTLLYQSRRNDFYKEVPNPEYVVYVLIRDHLVRITSSCIITFHKYPHLRYIEHNDRLQEEKISFLYNFFIFKKYTIFRSQHIPKEKSFYLMKLFFREIKKEFDKHWTNYKFIILIYDENPDTKNFFNEVNWQDLREDGFIIVSTSDLIGRTMDMPQDVIEDKFHPSASAWKIIAPAFVEKVLKNR